MPTVRGKNHRYHFPSKNISKAFQDLLANEVAMTHVRSDLQAFLILKDLANYMDKLIDESSFVNLINIVNHVNQYL